MKPWQLAVVGLACLAVAGCQTDPNIALLERELRLQEDEIYRLRDVVEEYRAALRSCREDAALPGRSTTIDSGPAEVPGLPRLQGVPSAEQETGSLPEGAGYGDLQSEAPPSPYGAPSEPPARGEQPDGPSEGESMQGPSDMEVPMPGQSDESGAVHGKEVRQTGGIGPIFPADSSEVARLGLNRRLTGGFDVDGRLGDDGIVVGLELRDARGRRVEAPADVSVVLLDPELAGEAARVARWDFTAAQMAADFRRTGPGRAIQLEMPWPTDPPAHGQLYLFVRYTTADGRRLQAEGPIRIAVPGEASRRWVSAAPASPQREASFSAEVDEPRRGRFTPAVRMPAGPSPSPDVEPAVQKIERPVWSPHRP